MTPEATIEELPWLALARSYLGMAEIPGPGNNQTISRWLGMLGGWWNDDETPWCGTFVAACLVEAGQRKPRHWFRARAYLDYGHELDRMAYGSIVVFERGGGGHVGFVVGRDRRNRVMCLGGNQGNRVSIAPFELWRVLGYRWPPTDAYLPVYPLPVLDAAGPSSSMEA